MRQKPTGLNRHKTDASAFRKQQGRNMLLICLSEPIRERTPVFLTRFAQ